MEELNEKILFPLLAKGVEIANIAKEEGYHDEEMIDLLKYSRLKRYYKDICLYFLNRINMEDDHLEVFEDFFEMVLLDGDFDNIDEIDDENEVVVIQEFTDLFRELVHIYRFVQATRQNTRISAFGTHNFPYEVVLTMTNILNAFLKHSTSPSDELVVKEINKFILEKANEYDVITIKQSKKSAPAPVAADVSSFAQFSSDVNEEALNEILRELHALIGMDDVKRQVQDLMNFIRVQRMRNEFGLRSIPSSYHIVFTGKPGTGKTTVARLIGRLYKEIGILSSGHTVETDRAGLVGEYIGHTAQKTEEKIQEALGGVLLIDEAYALTRDLRGQDFGLEAVDTLVKRMEDYREQFAVVITGYGKEIEQFVSSNPGLKSRFTKYIHFEDYSPLELVEIFKKICGDYDIRPSSSACQYVFDYFTSIYDDRDETFSNGRRVRTLFEKSLLQQANRLIARQLRSKDAVMALEKEDIDLSEK